MTVTVGTAGGNKASVALFVGTAGGNKAVQQAYVGTAGGNKLFFSAMTVVAAPASRTASGTGTISTGSTTATPTGGVAPYTYAWSINDPAITINNPTAATTSFSATPGAGQNAAGSAVCLVTDAIGSTASSNAVGVGITDIT